MPITRKPRHAEPRSELQCRRCERAPAQASRVGQTVRSVLQGIGEFQDGHKKNRGLTKADPGLHEFRARIARISPNARRSLLIECPLCA